MKFLNKAVFQSRLRGRFHHDNVGGWFYNCLWERFWQPIRISPRAKVETLVARTRKIVTATGSAYPLYAFPDGAAGWRAVPRNRRHSPIELADAEQLTALIREHLYFRDPGQKIDNYHITDGDLRWFVVFTHHDDWLFFAPPELIEKAKTARSGAAS